MQIAMASGKGGTGKTTVAVNLATVHDGPVCLLDCDVEEPNVHLFVNPSIKKSDRVRIQIPSFIMERCNSCGACRIACRFNAIVLIKGKPLLLKELCHSCGACVYACKENAIEEIDREIGTIEIGDWANGLFGHGKLDIGEARSEPIIEEVRALGKARPNDELVIVDAPPGTSCPVIAAVRGVDYVLLVTEPTPFGLHDLEAALNMVKALKMEAGIVINRCDIGDDRVRDFCRERGVPVLAEFPFDRRIAETYSRGEIASNVLPDIREGYLELMGKLLSGVRA